MLCEVTSAKHVILYGVMSAKHAWVSFEKIWMGQMGRMEEKIATTLLYRLHSFPLACLIFSLHKSKKAHRRLRSIGWGIYEIASTLALTF
jgi:hypothetical protein